MFKAEIYISLKSGISDPQGLTIKHALEMLGYKEVKDARIGKMVVLSLEDQDRKEAEKKVEQMCQKLLANPIIEEYSFNIEVIE